MSFNQSRSDKNDSSHYRKPGGRSGSSGNQRNFSGGGGGGGGGKGGGGSSAAPPQPSSSSSATSSNSSASLQTNRSFKKTGNGQGGQPRVGPVSANSESSNVRAAQNGAHVQNPLHGASDAPAASGVNTKPTNPTTTTTRSNRPVPRAPSSQTTSGVSDSVPPTTPAKGDSGNAFSFQFGSISPGFINGMQIPARTSSAPPNLDEQKRDQARHDSSGAVPTLPIPSIPKQQQQQQPRKDVGKFNQSNMGEPNLQLPQTKRDVHMQGPTAPSTTVNQKPSVPPVTGMPMSFQQPQVPLPFGTPNPQIQSQGVTTTSLQMPMPLPMGNASQMQQQVFVPSLQTHPLQPQGMIHQGQGLNFAPQIGHQMSPQLGNLAMGITPQFSPQQTGKFGALRKAVKITHPETHEELKLDKRTDAHLDGGTTVPRPHPNMTPQSQPIPSFASPHQMNYYSPMQANSYNPPNIFFQAQTSLPLTSTQMASNSQASRYNYPMTQGQQTLSFMNPSAVSALPVAKPGHAEASNSEHTNEVTIKPASGSRGEKVGPSSITVSAPIAHKGDSPKLLKPPRETTTLYPQKDSELANENSVQLSKSVSEPVSVVPPSATVKNPSTASAAVSLQKLPPSTSSSLDEPTLVMTNAEGRRKETVRRSDSFKDHQKKLNKRETQSLNQNIASDSGATSFQVAVSSETAKQPENKQLSPSEVVESPTSISNLPSRELVSLQDGNSETVEGKATSSLLGTSRSVLESTGEPIPDNSALLNSSGVIKDSVRIGEGSTCEPSNKSDLELEGAVSNSSVGVSHAKDGHTLQEVQLKQEFVETAEQGGTERSEVPKQDTEMPAQSTGSEELLEGIEQTENRPNLKEPMVGGETGSMEPEQATNKEAVSCSSEVIRTVDNLVRSDTASSDSIDSETASSGSALDAFKNSREISDGQDVIITTDSGTLQQGLDPISSEVNGEIDGKTTESTSSSVSGAKDKAGLEANKAKSTISKAKKKRKDILKAADAAGSTSDLYMAYKGPEEKLETAISSDVDLKQEPSDDVEKDVTANVEGLQGKAEPDDWEDAADISTPKLKTSDDGNLNHDGDGSGLTSRKYSRDFLLTFSEQCNELPMNFKIEPGIAEALMSDPNAISHHADRESYPNSGRIIDRPGGGPRPDRRGNVMLDDDKWGKSPGPFNSGRDPRLDIGQGGAVGGFRPGQGGNHGVLRNPRGHPSGQYVGGILSGPMQQMASQGGMPRNSPDADRWQRAAGFQKGLIPSPQTPLQIMHRAERKYEIGKTSDQEQAKQRQLKAILNKLTPQNFEKLFEQVKEVNIDNTVTLSGVISQIFDKALMEPTFCEMYANFCFHLSSALPDFSEDNEKITFKRLLLNKCQEEFERGEREQAEADRMEEEGEIKRSDEEREEKRIQARRRMLGNIRLIGELYKKKMLTERIMHECITKLLGQYQNPDEEDVEALCKLMSTIGEMIDHPKAKEHMDAYFDMMLKLSNNMKLSSRVRFMLKDSIDLRRNKWRQRRKIDGPKKIEEVHRDAAQERQAQSSRLARNPSMGSSQRRQPMDFAPRGSSMLSSPNAHMGGVRGLPSPARGYGAQDARFEERHPYESRTLSVPLSQRPIDDDSITLGPQGGLARGMSIRGQPLISGVPLVDMSSGPGDSRRMPAGPNGYNSLSGRPYDSREELAPRYIPERFTGAPAYDQLNSHERHPPFGNRDVRAFDPSLDRSMPSSPAPHVQGSSTVAQPISEKVLSEEQLRNMSINAIREFYSAKDEEEVALCVRDLNSPGFYPSMVSHWVTDSFERKDMERDLLAKLLINLSKSHNSLLTSVQLIKGFESVLNNLEDSVNDAPKAAEFLGRMLAKVIIENVISLREIGRLIHKGGEEPGRLLEVGLASEVLGSILEIIKSEKGESVLNDIRTSSNLRLEDFRPPAPMKARKLEAFI